MEFTRKSRNEIGEKISYFYGITILNATFHIETNIFSSKKYIQSLFIHVYLNR